MINQKEDEVVYPEEEVFSKQFHFFIIGYFDLIRVIYGEDYLELFSDEESGFEVKEGDQINSKNDSFDNKMQSVISEAKEEDEVSIMSTERVIRKNQVLPKEFSKDYGLRNANWTQSELKKVKVAAEEISPDVTKKQEF